MHCIQSGFGSKEMWKRMIGKGVKIQRAEGVKKKVLRMPSHEMRHLAKKAFANFLRHQFGGVRWKYVWQCSGLRFWRPSTQRFLRWFWHAHILHTDQQSVASILWTFGGLRPTRKCRAQIKIPLWHLGNSIIFWSHPRVGVASGAYKLTVCLVVRLLLTTNNWGYCQLRSPSQ